MYNIRINNTTRLDKTAREFVLNPDNKTAGSRGDINNKEYLEIIRKTMPEKLEMIPFQDHPLTKEESQKLLAAFGEEVERLLEERDRSIKGNQDYEFRGKKYRLDLRNGHWHIIIVIRTYDLINECIQQDKPVYLGIIEQEPPFISS